MSKTTKTILERHTKDEALATVDKYLDFVNAQIFLKLNGLENFANMGDLESFSKIQEGLLNLKKMLKE